MIREASRQCRSNAALKSLWSPIVAVRPDVLGQLAAEEISKGSVGQARKEIARDDAEPVGRAKFGERLLNIGRGRPKQARKLLAGQRCQSLCGGMLRHLTEVGAFAAVANMPIDSASECRNNLEECGLA
jgi:hypothetical protein